MRIRPFLLSSLVASMIATSSGAFLSPSWASGATLCTTTISGPTVTGNVIVPPGASCFLADVTVKGDVVVQGDGSLFTDYHSGVETTTVTGNLIVAPGGFLSTDSGTTVKGNLSSTGAEDNLKNLSVQGNLSITGATGLFDAISGGSVGGNAVFASNSPQLFVGEGQTAFGGNVVFSGNTAVIVIGGVIAGNLVCFGNGSVSDSIPFPPFTTAPVTVLGHALGQCAPPISVP